MVVPLLPRQSQHTVLPSVAPQWSRLHPESCMGTASAIGAHRLQTYHPPNTPRSHVRIRYLRSATCRDCCSSKERIRPGRSGHGGPASPIVADSRHQHQSAHHRIPGPEGLGLQRQQHYRLQPGKCLETPRGSSPNCLCIGTRLAALLQHSAENNPMYRDIV